MKEISKEMAIHLFNKWKDEDNYLKQIYLLTSQGDYYFAESESDIFKHSFIFGIEDD